ncbi:hypothetical protein BH20ACT6_BH20ACT6_18780 [soil metagenome]
MDEMSYHLALQQVADRTRDARRHHERLGGVPPPANRRASGWLRRERPIPDDPT